LRDGKSKRASTSGRSLLLSTTNYPRLTENSNAKCYWDVVDSVSRLLGLGHTMLASQCYRSRIRRLTCSGEMEGGFSPYANTSFEVDWENHTGKYCDITTGNLAPQVRRSESQRPSASLTYPHASHSPRVHSFQATFENLLTPDFPGIGAIYALSGFGSLLEIRRAEFHLMSFTGQAPLSSVSISFVDLN
jgi:hypothetical protein